MSKESKMFATLPPSYLPEQREFWGDRFGSLINLARSQAGLSIEDAARLSNMETSEWAAIEEGQVPQATDQLRAMAAAMNISFNQIVTLVLLCRKAWKL